MAQLIMQVHGVGQHKVQTEEGEKKLLNLALVLQPTDGGPSGHLNLGNLQADELRDLDLDSEVIVTIQKKE